MMLSTLYCVAQGALYFAVEKSFLALENGRFGSQFTIYSEFACDIFIWTSYL